MKPLICPSPRAAATLIFGVVLASSPLALAQGTDEQWEITSKMEMPGMPMAMPPQVVRLCVGKNSKDEDFIPKQNTNCRMLESKRTGNKYTYKMQCGGSEPSTAEGEVTFATGSYQGKTKLVMAQMPHPMQMNFSGQRVGNCTAPAK